MTRDTARRWPLLLRTAVPGLGALAVALAARLIGGPVAALTAGVVITGLALLTIRRLDRRPYAEAGLVRPGLAWRHLLLGFLAWLLPSVVVIMVLAAGGQVGLRFPDGFGWLGPAAVQLAVIMVGQVLPYEMIFRASVQANLAERFGGWNLIIGQGLLYGAFLTCLRLVTGFGSVTVLILDGTFAVCVGIALGYARAVSDSVWVSAGLHLAQLTVTGLIGDSVLGLVDRPLGWLPALFAYGVVPFAAALVCVETLVRHRPRLMSRT